MSNPTLTTSIDKTNSHQILAELEEKIKGDKFTKSKARNLVHQESVTSPRRSKLVFRESSIKSPHLNNNNSSVLSVTKTKDISNLLTSDSSEYVNKRSKFTQNLIKYNREDTSKLDNYEHDVSYIKDAKV